MPDMRVRQGYVHTRLILIIFGAERTKLTLDVHMYTFGQWSNALGAFSFVLSVLHPNLISIDLKKHKKRAVGLRAFSFGR